MTPSGGPKVGGSVDPWGVLLPDGGPGPAVWRDRGLRLKRLLLLGVALLVLVYSFAVLKLVASMGDIGVRCFFGTEQGVDVKEPVADAYAWEPSRPLKRDWIVSIGPKAVANYADYIKAVRGLEARI